MRCSYRLVEAYTDEAAQSAHVEMDYYKAKVPIIMDCLEGGAYELGGSRGNLSRGGFAGERHAFDHRPESADRHRDPARPRDPSEWLGRRGDSPLLEARGVLLFREIQFSDEEQIAFTRTLGEPANQAGKGLLYKITLDAKENAMADYLKGTFYWHIDSTTSDYPPAPPC